jgi:ABC-2 type transport system permease protein
VVSVLAGLAGVIVVFGARKLAPEVPEGVMAVPRGDGVMAAGTALTLRNFFVLPLLLAQVAAAGLAGDGADRTLRDLLLAPVSRTRVLAVRLGALTLLSAACTLLTLLASLLPGLALLGAGGNVGRLALGYAASVASDVGLLAATACLALWMRSATGTVVALLFGLMLDLGARMALKAAGGLASMGIAGLSVAPRLVPFTFGAGLACWEGWEDGFQAAAFASLAVWTTLFLMLARARIEHTEVA